MGGPHTGGTSKDSDHYREMASKLRELARQCRLPGARREILDLGMRYDRRADHFDARSAFAASNEDSR